MASEHVERKLAAIVAVDVAGYSRLMAADEEGTLARLKAHRKALIDPKIVEHSGRIIKTTGDGMLVEFASVVDAVRCVVEIQRGMLERNADIPADKRIDFRVGINIGDVIVDGDDIYGDGVNVAARLEGLAEPGGILVSGVVRDQVRDKLSFSFDDLGDRNVKNISRPVRAYRVNLSDDGRPPLAAKPTRKLAVAGRPIAWIAAAVLLAIVGAGGSWYLLNANRTAPAASNAAAPSQAAHLSIVVLPFTNLSGDPAQDYFADGITENLTTDLSRIRNSFVIARNTAFTFKGKNVDAKQIGKELGVRYVLEGSVQRDQNRVRVNAQLIDAQSGAHLWADRFEENIADLFKLQDQVVARLANTLRYELVFAEAEKDANSRNPDAIDLAMRGWGLLRAGWGPQISKDDNDAARALFSQALQIDPSNADALAGDAATYIREYLAGKNPEIDYEAKILGQADRSIALDRGNINAYQTKGVYLQISARPNDALRTFEAGLAIDPSSAALYAMRGSAETYLGQFDKAKSDLQQAMLLSPRDLAISRWHNLMADVELGLGHFDAVIDESNKAVDGGYRIFYTYLNLAAAHAFKGEMDDAKSAMVEARRLNPNLSIKWLNEHKPVLQYAFDGLRKAGLPEQ